MEKERVMNIFGRRKMKGNVGKRGDRKRNMEKGCG
jgi:hypothetical protein